MDDSGPAFAYGNNEQGGSSGMTLRDWFAGQALEGLCAGADMNVEDHAAHFAAAAYIIADAMLAERAQ